MIVDGDRSRNIQMMGKILSLEKGEEASTREQATA